MSWEGFRSRWEGWSRGHSLPRLDGYLSQDTSSLLRSGHVGGTLLVL